MFLILVLTVAMASPLRALTADEERAVAKFLESPKARTDRRLKEVEPSFQLRMIRKQAEAGEADAQRRYGLIWLNGYGVKKDPAAGIRWLAEAAQQRDADALVDLGMCYVRGNGVEQDFTEAARLFALAATATKPSAEGLYNVAISQEFGCGTLKHPWDARDNMVKAAELGCAAAVTEVEARQYKRLPRKLLLERAAEGGNAEAQFCIGYDLLTGSEGEERPVEAVQWLRRAAEQGHAKASIYYASLLEKTNPTEAALWYAKAAATGNSHALAKQQELKARERRYPIARWEEAAARGDADAQAKLAMAYYNGDGVPMDLVKSLDLTRKAVAQGNPVAEAYMGLFYYGGHGVKKDMREAVSWWTKAAAQGVAMAQHNLGWALSEPGRGTEPDPKEALEWYRKAANQGYGPSLHALGLAHRDGKGVPVDLKAAEFWLQTGTDLGDPSSATALAWFKEEQSRRQMPAAAAMAVVMPLTREEIEERLTSRMATAVIVAELKRRGYSGFINAGMMTELKKKGADEELLRELRRAVGPVVP